MDFLWVITDHICRMREGDVFIHVWDSVHDALIQEGRNPPKGRTRQKVAVRKGTPPSPPIPLYSFGTRFELFAESNIVFRQVQEASWRCVPLHNLDETSQCLNLILMSKPNKCVLNLEKHVCSICGKSFARKDTLKLHQKRHGPKELECDYCGKMFAEKNALKIHER